MLNEQELYKRLKNIFLELPVQNGTSYLTKLCTDVNKKFGFPIGMVSDIVTLRVDMEDALEALLYAIVVSLNNNKIHIEVSKYFTIKDIAAFSKYKYTGLQSVKFPFTFESLMIEVKPGEQYIGKTTVKELMKLRDAQVINYNINTQRTLELKKGKDFEYYRIALNREAVSQITDLMQNEDYIPTTLTFNLSPETDFTYQNGKLTINEQVPFDILDGYHRYIAMSNLYNINNEFDYPMEIRIMFLSEENARQFIFQEDQRTPLAKIDTEAMNKNDVGVQVCRQIKNKLGNKIVGQKGIINEALLIRLIDLLYIDRHTTYKQSKIIGLANVITDGIYGVLADVDVLLDGVWDNNFTIIFFGLMQQGLKGGKLYETAIQKADALDKQEKIELLTKKRINKLINA